MDPLASWNEKNEKRDSRGSGLTQEEVDRVTQRYRQEQGQTVEPSGKSIRISLGDILKVEVRLRKVVTWTAIVALCSGILSYVHAIDNPAPATTSASAIAAVFTPDWKSQVDTKLVVLGNTDVEIKEILIELRKDMREQREDIRAMRSRMEQGR